MAVDVKLPRLGQGMEAGTIVRWLKSEGDAVAKGEPLYELDTDKVTQEVEAEADGVLLKIVVHEGEVDVGTTIAVIGSEGEVVEIEAPPAPALAAPQPPAAPERGAEEPPDALSRGPVEAPVAPTPAERGAPRPAAAQATGGPVVGRVKASPLARRLARERGVALTNVIGTGPDGRIVADDVEKAARQAQAVGLEIPSAEIEVVELTSIRRTIAKRLTEAWEAPVFQLTVTVDASELTATRARMVELLDESDSKPTVNDVLTRLAAAALMRHPAVNARFVEGRIYRYPAANIGIAVATPNGLVVPVLRSAERKSVREIATARADLVARAREGRLQLSDLEDGTFTVSNLGMYGIEQFVAVLNPPQVAILAVGSIEERPWAVEGELGVAPTMTMTLTCDHRALDGSEGAEFLRTLRTLVEAPALAL